MPGQVGAQVDECDRFVGVGTEHGFVELGGAGGVRFEDGEAELDGPILGLGAGEVGGGAGGRRVQRRPDRGPGRRLGRGRG